jgi:hypothetical protein
MLLTRVPSGTNQNAVPVTRRREQALELGIKNAAFDLNNSNIFRTNNSSRLNDLFLGLFSRL